VSLHGIVGPRDQSSPHLENKYGITIPLILPNFVVRQQKMCLISTFKNFWPPLGGKKWTIVNQNRLRPATDQCLSSSKFYRARPNDVRETRYKIFYPLVNFGTPSDPLGQSSPILELMYNKAQSVNVCQISSHSDNLCTRYLLPNCADLVDSVTDKQTYKRKKNSKRQVPTYHVVTIM